MSVIPALMDGNGPGGDGEAATEKERELIEENQRQLAEIPIRMLTDAEQDVWMSILGSREGSRLGWSMTGSSPFLSHPSLQSLLVPPLVPASFDPDPGVGPEETGD